VSSVAHPGLLLIYSFIYYLFVVVSAAGRESTTKCNCNHSVGVQDIQLRVCVWKECRTCKSQRNLVHVDTHCPVVNVKFIIHITGWLSRYSGGLRASVPGRGKRFFSSSTQRPDGPWSPPNLVIQWVSELSPRGKSSRDVKRTIRFHPVPRSRIVELYLHFHITSS
jgi:hypothetical protein